MKTVELKERIEKLLRYLDITQKELAQKTGIPENTISHAKKGKHVPNIEFFNSIYRLLPHINAQWLYMGMGDMFSETKQNLHEAGKEFLQKVSNLKRKLNEVECNEELEKAENEINYLKAQVEDKNEIINLLKTNAMTSSNRLQG